jgi:hypothetical protein
VRNERTSSLEESGFLEKKDYFLDKNVDWISDRIRFFFHNIQLLDLMDGEEFHVWFPQQQQPRDNIEYYCAYQHEGSKFQD